MTPLQLCPCNVPSNFLQSINTKIKIPIKIIAYLLLLSLPSVNGVPYSIYVVDNINYSIENNS
jgi:hypothetical protein